MNIVIFAEQFRKGEWDVFEHRCSSLEAQAVLEIAQARAFGQTSTGQPTHHDLLQSARQLFDITNGTPGNPSHGDLRVYCVCIDTLVVGEYKKISFYSPRLAETHRLELARTA